MQRKIERKSFLSSCVFWCFLITLHNIQPSGRTNKKTPVGSVYLGAQMSPSFPTVPYNYILPIVALCAGTNEPAWVRIAIRAFWRRNVLLPVKWKVLVKHNMKERLVEVFWVGEGLEQDFRSWPNTVQEDFAHRTQRQIGTQKLSARKRLNSTSSAQLAVPPLI